MLPKIFFSEQPWDQTAQHLNSVNSKLKIKLVQYSFKSSIQWKRQCFSIIGINISPFLPEDIYSSLPSNIWILIWDFLQAKLWSVTEIQSVPYSKSLHQSANSFNFILLFLLFQMQSWIVRLKHMCSFWVLFNGLKIEARDQV